MLHKNSIILHKYIILLRKRPSQAGLRHSGTTMYEILVVRPQIWYVHQRKTYVRVNKPILVKLILISTVKVYVSETN